MSQANELPIENGILTQTADGNTHATLVIHVLLDLRTIIVGQVLDELLRRMRQSKLGSLARVVDQAIDELFLGRVLAEVDEHGGGVTVEHRHANALRRDLQWTVERHDFALFFIDVTEHLQRFLFGLLLFAGDERNDVAHHFRPVVERLARAGNGLVSAYDNLARLEFLPSGERRSVGLDGAVWLDGDEAVRGAETLALVLDHLIMLRVDFWHDHRHVRSPAVGAVVRYDRRFGFRVFLFDGADLGLRHVHCGEHEIDVLDHVFHVSHVLDDHVLHEFRHRRFHLPATADGLFVGLAGAVRGRGKGDQFEPRMVFEQRDEALSDHARSSENADLNLFGHNNLSLMLERFRMISRLRSTSRPKRLRGRPHALFYLTKSAEQAGSPIRMLVCFEFYTFLCSARGT